MADEIRIIQVNTGTTSQWNNQVRPLGVGEFGYNSVTKELKIGDGVTSFANLKAFLTGDNAIGQLQALINAANGLAGLDANAKVPEANLPVQFFVGELKYLLVIRPGFVWANGQVLTDVTASYPKLKEWLKNAGTYGGAFLRKTLTEWNAEWNDTKWNAPDTGSAATRAGMSPYYVLDESTDTIKVPDLRGAYRAAAGFDGQESGMTLADATRVIRGGFGELGNTGAADNGAIAVDSISGITNLTFTSGTSNLAWIWRRLDSSRVVPVAKTNRPRSIVLYLCLYAGPPA